MLFRSVFTSQDGRAHTILTKKWKVCKWPRTSSFTREYEISRVKKCLKPQVWMGSRLYDVILRRENTSHNYSEFYNMDCRKSTKLWPHMTLLKLWDVFSRLTVTCAHLNLKETGCAAVIMGRENTSHNFSQATYNIENHNI